MLKSRVFVLLLALLSFLVIGCALRQDSGFPNPSFGVRQPLPFFIMVDVNIRPEFRERILDAVDTWNETMGSGVFVYEEIDIQTVILRGIIQAPPYRRVYLYMTELGLTETGSVILGLTQRAFRSGHIYNCIVWLDEDLLETSVFPVALHELGHVLGLGHTEDRSSVMFLQTLDSEGNITSQNMEEIKDRFGIE